MTEGDANPSALPAKHVIFVRYVFFALVSGLANLASQEAAVRTVQIAPLIASLVVGTGVGFVVKYILDKRWIFLDGYDGHAAEIRKVMIYGTSSVFTTLLFWAIELGAWHTWQTTEAKYIGAAIGLSLGNLMKYMLDRHYVFPRATA